MFENLTTLTLYSTDARALDDATKKILDTINNADVILSVTPKQDLSGVMNQTRQFKFIKMEDKLLERLTRLDISQNVHLRFRDAE
jgi:ribosomal protein S10